jgi:hypothetical protein
MNNQELDESMIIGTVKDLGMAAYLKMIGFRFFARRGKEYDFKIKESEQDDFNTKKIEYLNSQFSVFDSEIMNLKKL